MHYMSYETLRTTWWYKTVTACVLIAVGILIGWWYRGSAEKPQTFKVVREDSSGYTFIDPLLFTQNSEDTSLPEYASLKKSINEYVAKALSSAEVASTSVYFRDLNSNLWFGINANEKYTPASMFKVASLIAFLRKAETNSELLSSKVKILPTSIDLNAFEYYTPADPVKVGQTYTVQDLLTRMIVNSDNIAVRAIDVITGDELLKKTYTDLQLTQTGTTTNILISPQVYSRIFRVLFNATYLSHSLSEQTLSLLSKTTFTQGLVAGVPSDTLVAHKFGEWAEDTKKGTVHELHDCGIVYYPKHPYFLCVMTRSQKDFPTLQKVIRDISTMTWNSIQKLYPR